MTQNTKNFDGTRDYALLPSAGMSDFSTGFSAGIWAYPTATGSGTRFFDFGNGMASNNIFLCRNGTSNDLSFFVYNGSTGSQLTAAGAIELNKWQYFSVSLQPTTGGYGTATIYKDGTAIASGSVYMPNNTNRSYNYVGKSNWTTGADTLFTGQMRDLTIWNKAITAAQIKANMNATPATGTPSLLSAYPLGSTTVANDTPSAFAFNGPNPYYNAGASANLNLTTQGSLEAWIYPTGTGSSTESGGVILSKAGEYELVRFPDGTIRWQFANSSAAFDTQARFVLDANGSATNLATGQAATWTGAESYDTGRSGQAFSLDGSNYVSLNPNGLSDFSRGFSASLWINPAGKTSSSSRATVLPTRSSSPFRSTIRHTSASRCWLLKPVSAISMV
jgi:hypothetical protein